MNTGFINRHGSSRGLVAAVMAFVGALPGAAVLAGSPLADGSVDTAQLVELLKTEAVPQWRELADKLKVLNFTYKLSETSKTRGAARSGTKLVTGHVSGDSFLLEEASETPLHTSVYSRNDRYEFSLDRSGAAAWVINWQHGRQKLDTPVGSEYEYLVGMMELPWSISATPLEKLVSDERFRIKHGASKSGVVDLEFEVSPTTARPDPLQNLVSGALVLDSLHHWAVKRYSVTYLNKMTSTVQLSYGVAGPPELQRAELEVDSPPNSTNKFVLSDFHYDTGPVDTAGFTLSAFGLPEYREPFGTRRWLVLINIGLICVIVGVILFRRKQLARVRTVRGARAGTVML
ncbi:MAG TPA: hypothetical protein VH107_05975 [Lacipirellulaceae bacterium]|jgi:hypothetical protein|nr:hypothetical protein [Lacipirellulaceae bacterium]